MVELVFKSAAIYFGWKLHVTTNFPLLLSYIFSNLIITKGKLAVIEAVSEANSTFSECFYFLTILKIIVYVDHLQIWQLENMLLSK